MKTLLYVIFIVVFTCNMLIFIYNIVLSTIAAKEQEMNVLQNTGNILTIQVKSTKKVYDIFARRNDINVVEVK